MFAPFLFLFSFPSPHNHPGLSDPTYHGHSTEPTVALLLSLSPAAVSDDHRQRGGRTRTGETAVQDRERERETPTDKNRCSASVVGALISIRNKRQRGELPYVWQSCALMRDEPPEQPALIKAGRLPCYDPPHTIRLWRRRVHIPWRVPAV